MDTYPLFVADPPDVGAPWPGGRFGEVVGPARERAYLAVTAGVLAGRTTKWARTRVTEGDVAGVRGRIAGRQGPEPYFLEADAFETLGSEQGWWPPSATRIALATGEGPALPPAVLARMDGLEREKAALEDALETALRDRDDLLAVVQTLSEQARRRPVS